MSGEGNVDELIDALKKEKEERVINKTLKSKNNEIIQTSEEVEEFKILKNGEENYVWKPGENLKCEALVKKNASRSKLLIRNKMSSHDMPGIIIHSKNISKEGENRFKVKFNWKSNILEAPENELTLFVDDKEILSGLKIQVQEGEKELGERIILKGPIKNYKFPEGSFYVFGSSKNIVEKFENGEISVPVILNDNLIDFEELKQRYGKGKILNFEGD